MRHSSPFGNQNTDVDTVINRFNTAGTETANDFLGKHRSTKKPWVTDDILKLCDKRRELKETKNTAEGTKLYREANQQVRKGKRKAKETWTEEQCQGNTNSNNNRIQRRNSRLFTISSLRREPSNTYAQVARAKLCENHVQHIERLPRATCVTCHMAQRNS